MSDLVAWLRERVNEDERVARDCGVQLSDGQLHLRDGDTITIDARRVLAEVEAKRAIIALHDAELIEAINADGDERSGLWCTECDYEAYPCPTILALAKVYADRPGYDEAVKA